MNEHGGFLLVVDDNEMNRDMLSRRLERKGYRVVTAGGAARAQELIEEHPLDLVLLDIMMPGVDGMQMLERLREKHSPSRLPVIMATARDRSEDVVRALEKGANDYVIKPLDFPVVLARVQTQLLLKRATEALAAAHDRMKRDLQAAARIQQSLLPAVPPAVQGARFAWRFEPCDELAGDMLGVCPLNPRQVALYLLDVSGHGVPAALLSVALNRVLSNTGDGSLLLEENSSGKAGGGVIPPADVAGRLNRRFPMDPETSQYFTLLYGVLDLERLELRYVAAGHPGPVHSRPGEGPRLFDSAGFAIGFFAQATFEEQCLKLQPGDRLCLYSDGIVEASNPNQEMFGAQRLQALLGKSGTRPLADSLSAVVAAVKEWRGADGLEDDISLLGVEIT